MNTGHKLLRCTFSLVLAFVTFASFGRADDASDADWKAFREIYRFHIQTIAISGRHPDRSRTLIISEPPPHVTLEGLAEIDPLFKNALTMKNPIGHDGWTKDLVLEVPNSSDPAFQTLIAKLS